MRQGMHYTLEEVRRGQAQLYPQHLEIIKRELLNYVRADWKKQRIMRLNVHTIMNLPPHWCFARFVFSKDGSVNGGQGYVVGQDYNSEMKEVTDAFVGKRQ